MPKLTIGQNLRETLDNSFTETFGKKEPPGKTGGSSYAGIALCFLHNT